MKPEAWVAPQRLAAMLTASQTATALTEASDAHSLRRSTTDQIARQARRARQFALDQEVRALHAQGVSKRHMDRQLQIRRTTVIRDLHTTTCPERAQSRRISALDPCVAYLQTRWDAGCHTDVQLWREMQALGFPGTRCMVSHGVVLRRERSRSRPSAYGQRPALPKPPAIPLLPAPVEE